MNTFFTEHFRTIEHTSDVIIGIEVFYSEKKIIFICMLFYYISGQLIVKNW